jgi:hypothetical protein
MVSTVPPEVVSVSTQGTTGERPLPAGYLSGIAAAIGAFVVLPYTEEMIRCVRARRDSGDPGPDDAGHESLAPVVVSPHRAQ